MYLYQAFNLRMQLISIFQRLSQIYREFVWKAFSPNLNFGLKYFRNIVIVMTKGKNEKTKTTKIYFFLLPPLPSQDGGGGGGGLVQPPTPQLFPRQKFFENFFHRYMGIWTKGGKIDRSAILAKTQKWYEEKSEGLQQPPPPPNWERED